jgi:aryl-alcohol dehydrogenase-like predicted oxidoreductase
VGCNNFGGRIDETRTREVIDAALDQGINFFDTADMYADGRSEELIGRFIVDRGHRSEALIATKFGQDMPGQGRGARPEYIKRAFEASLKRLRTDHVDLYQLHLPDPDVPIAETLGALDELVKAGKVREIGCSNFSAQQIAEAENAAERRRICRFVAFRGYSLLHRDPESVLAECERLGLAFLPFFPLMSGLLTGKYRKGGPIPEGTRVAKYERYRKLLTDENLDRVESLIGYAESRGHTILELAFSWLLAHRVVASVIAGASSAQQVRANVGAAGWRLDAAELSEIDAFLSREAGSATA